MVHRAGGPIRRGTAVRNKKDAIEAIRLREARLHCGVPRVRVAASQGGSKKEPHGRVQGPYGGQFEGERGRQDEN